MPSPRRSGMTGCWTAPARQAVVPVASTAPCWVTTRHSPAERTRRSEPPGGQGGAAQPRAVRPPPRPPPGGAPQAWRAPEWPVALGHGPVTRQLVRLHRLTDPGGPDPPAQVAGRLEVHALPVAEHPVDAARLVGGDDALADLAPDRGRVALERIAPAASPLPAHREHVGTGHRDATRLGPQLLPAALGCLG